MVRLARVFVVVLSLMALAACGPVQAKAPAPPPALTAPPPPTPLIVPVTIEYTEPEAKPTQPATTPEPAAPKVPPTTAAKPAVNPTPPAASTTPPSETPVTTTPVLQTTSDATEAERKVQEQIDSANRDLDKVTVTTLSKDGRDSYNSARRFIQLAQDNIKTRNFSLALEWAKKAAQLAAQLPKSDQ